MASRSNNNNNDNNLEEPSQSAIETTNNIPAQGSQQPPPPPTENQQQQNAPAMGYPPTIGYPPAVGQPGAGYYQPYTYDHQQPYDPYNVRAPPTTYYVNQNRQFQSTNFARGVLIGITLLISFTLFLSLSLWVILRPQVPKFYISSLSVTNYNASAPQTFTANWEANLTVDNANKKLRVYSEEIQSSIYYGDEALLASSAVPKFDLKTKTKSSIIVTLGVNQTEKAVFDGKVVDQMEMEKRLKGWVSFNLRLSLRCTFKKGNWYEKSTGMRVLCDGLRVKFVADTGNGDLLPNNVNGVNVENQCMVVFPNQA